MEATEKISICDILRDNTTKVIKKLESQIPTGIQTQSDLYTKYLHMLDDYFGTCYLWQKQYFDKLGFDEKSLHLIDDYWKVITDLYITQIDMISGAQKFNADARSKMLELCDQYIHQTIDYYGKIFSESMLKTAENKA